MLWNHSAVVRLDEKKCKGGRFSQCKSSEWHNCRWLRRLTCETVTDSGSNYRIGSDFLASRLCLSENKYCHLIFLKCTFSEYLICQKTNIKVISCDYKHGHTFTQRLPKKYRNCTKARLMQPTVFFEIRLGKFQICFIPIGSSLSMEELRESFLEPALHPVWSTISSTLWILNTLQPILWLLYTLP